MGSCAAAAQGGSEAARVLPAGRAGSTTLGEGSEGRAGEAARGVGRRPPAGSGTLDAWVSSAGGGVLWGGVHVPVTQSTAQNPFPWGGVRCGPWADGVGAFFIFIFKK